MSEFTEEHSIAKLIGSPPGYIGHGEHAKLADDITKHPSCVLVLDEIEKCHPKLFSLFLGVMDNARMTDSTGREIDFRQVILIMTTNAGAYEMSKRTVGFGGGLEVSKSNSAIERLFAPEFRNRLDGIISFQHLSKETIHKVVDKLVAELGEQLKSRGVKIRLSDSGREWLAEHGYDVSMGARPMARLIDVQIRRKLADELLFGKLANGGVIEVDQADGELIIRCKSKVEEKV